MYDKNKAEWIDDGRGLNLDGNFIELLEQMIERHEDNADRITSIFFSSTMRSHQQLNLIQVLNAEELRGNNIFILFDFYNKYINNLSKLMYSDWFTACFMRQNTNSSVWGNYGDNHTGVCMILKQSKRTVLLNFHFTAKPDVHHQVLFWGMLK
jgi:predicted O-linked N-acetylglucosamine transferase (SPINDLY family)